MTQPIDGINSEAVQYVLEREAMAGDLTGPMLIPQTEATCGCIRCA